MKQGSNRDVIPNHNHDFTWTTKTPMPVARSSGATGIVGNTIYTINGFDGNPVGTGRMVEAYDAANETIKKILKISPDSAEVQNILGSVFYKLGGVDNFLKAEKHFWKAIELKPDYAPAHFELALVFERQGRLDDAVGKMESVAQYNVLDVGVYFQLGLLYVQRAEEGDIDRAKETFEYVIKLAPNYSNAHWFLASIYEMDGDISAAVSEVEAVLVLNPTNELVKARLDRLIGGQISNTFPEAIEEK